MTGFCGGLCWDFYTFTDTGRVYTRDPEISLADAACTRRLPNGLPVCTTYTLGRRNLRIGTGPPESFRITRKRIKVGSSEYLKVSPVTAKRLRGQYISTTSITTPGVGAVFAQRKFIFAETAPSPARASPGALPQTPTGVPQPSSDRRSRATPGPTASRATPSRCASTTARYRVYSSGRSAATATGRTRRAFGSGPPTTSRSRHRSGSAGDPPTPTPMVKASPPAGANE